MGLGALQPKQLIRWNDRILRLDGKFSDGSWHMTETGSGLMDKQAEKDLLSAIELGELVFVQSDSSTKGKQTEALLDRLSVAAVSGSRTTAEGDNVGSNATKKLCYVDCIKSVPPDQRTQAIKHVWIQLGWPGRQPGYSTVMRWKKRCNGKADRVAALRDRHELKGRTGHRYSEDVIKLLREVRDVHYLCRSPRITVKRAVEIAGDRIRILNAEKPKSQHMPIPKRKAMLAVINEVDAVEVIALRFGADAALMAMRTSLGGVKTSRPLERAEIDHTKLAVILLDDDFEPLGRASFTCVKDVHARSVLGYYWGAEVPSIVALARCIRHAIFPKGEFLKKFPNVENEWVCYGVAEVWALDNGMEEHAAALRQGASQLGVQRIEFSARKTPWHKAHIERHLRTQDQDLLQNLPGATMENIAARTDFDPRKDLLIRASVFGRLLAKWVVDVYMQKRQAVLRNRSPTEAWMSALGSFTPFLPSETDLLDRLFLRQIDGRTLDHEGIEYDCLIYNSLDMKVLREKFGPKLKVNIRVSDEDRGFIFVGVPNYDIWVKVPCLDPAYANGLTKWQHEKCKRMQRTCADDGIELSLAMSRQQLLDDIDTEKGAVKQGRKMARQRMKEQSFKSGDAGGDLLLQPVGGLEGLSGKTESASASFDDDAIPDFDSQLIERDAA